MKYWELGEIPDSQKNIPPPRPDLNAGLYTGSPFENSAPWRNFPSIPDASYAVQNNLRSALPPPGASTQPPGTLRIGNSDFQLPTPALKPYSPLHNFMCVASDPGGPLPTPRPPSFPPTASLPSKAWRNGC